jgi:protein TonB
MNTSRWLPPTSALAALLALAACGPRPAEEPIVPSTPLRAVDTPPPEYPQEIGCDQIGGIAKLRVTVGPEGRPTQVEVIDSSRTPALDQAAVKGVQRWRFEAATRNGKPVSTDIQVPVTFHAPAERPEHCGAQASSTP